MEGTKAVSVHDSKIVKKLIDLGVIPPQCKRWNMRAEVEHVFIIESEVIVTPEQLKIIENVLEEFPEERQAAQIAIFKALKDGDDDLTGIGDEFTRRAAPRKVKQEG